MQGLGRQFLDVEEEGELQDHLASQNYEGLPAEISGSFRGVRHKIERLKF